MYEDQNPLLAQVMEHIEIAFRYVLLNFIWTLSILPFAAGFFWALRYLFGITEPPWVYIFIPVLMAAPATGGLYFATNQLAHGKEGGLTVYWQGVKSFLGSSYVWGVINLVMAFLFSVNIWFYGQAPWGFAPYVRIAFILVAAFWATIQFYTFPFMIEQNEPSYKTALRNGFLASARFPLRSFGFLLLILAIVFISVIFYLAPWVLITMSLITYLSNKNTIYILEKMLAQDREQQVQQDQS